eukprot:gnl/Dysnectes_brevis/2650_a3207_1323.p1 GENE.gnl/Dysnectes_brevis/2650_a3207_1323~~gnl/Dysnectes_brevis/2650_a3207_1323.p1  ORF type:complete len:162 (-),score=12.46 gnl/Dysnectes_brevis/2650_a3207_1323:43-528(-)
MNSPILSYDNVASADRCAAILYDGVHSMRSSYSSSALREEWERLKSCFRSELLSPTRLSVSTPAKRHIKPKRPKQSLPDHQKVDSKSMTMVTPKCSGPATAISGEKDSTELIPAPSAPLPLPPTPSLRVVRIPVYRAPPSRLCFGSFVKSDPAKKERENSE